MSEEVKCKQEKEMLKMICEIEKLYKYDFGAWEECYKQLVNAVFDKENNKTYKKKSSLAWLNDDFVKSYPTFKYLKENKSNVFSFIVMLNKYGVKSRQEIAKKILGDTYEETKFTGVPSGQLGMSEETFKNISETKKLDDNLNKIAYKLINAEEIIEEDLEIKISNTFKNVFFILAPQKYYPSDSNTRSILEKISKDKEPLEIKISDEEGEFYTRAVSYCAWLKENQIDNILNKFIDNDTNKPKNIILTGIPGTGKTHSINEFLKEKVSKDQYEIVQFHPSYDYEDFIEGLKPVPSKDGQIEFKLVDGVFKKLCKKAFNDSGKTYVMVIDEINRANLSRVFGELLYCLEYRDEFVSTKMTTYIESLDKQKQKRHSINKEKIGKFSIPSNVIILGTMNEVDRSIDAFDLALRRRFIWEDVGFSETALRLYTPFFTKGFQGNIEALVEKAKELNKKLSDEIGANYQLGHTYYFKIADYFGGDFDSALCDLWEYHLKSIVREYCKVKFGEGDLEEKLKEYKKIIVTNCNG